MMQNNHTISVHCLEYQSLLNNRSNEWQFSSGLNKIPVFESLLFLSRLEPYGMLDKNPFSNCQHHQAAIDFAEKTNESGRFSEIINSHFEKVGWGGMYIFYDKQASFGLIEEILKYGDWDNFKRLSADEYSRLFITYVYCLNKTLKERISNLNNITDISQETLIKKMGVIEYYFNEYQKVLSIEEEKFRKLINYISRSNNIIFDQFKKGVIYSDPEGYIGAIRNICCSEIPLISDIENIDQDILNSLCINLTYNQSNFEKENKLDFILLRDYPLFYNKEANSYLSISTQFVKDKLYQNLKFNISSNYSTLNSVLGKEFFEEILFYDIIKPFVKNGDINFSGKEIEKLGQGGSDYYIRRENKILLFEVKDYTLGSESSMSGDFVKIRNTIISRLGKKEGVQQLLNNINEINSAGKYQKLDNGLSTIHDIDIYPIIVVGGIHYLTDGIKVLLNDKLNELNNNGCIFRDLTIIHVDTFYRYMEKTLMNTFDLFECLNSYSEHLQKEGVNKFQTFEVYLKYVRFEIKTPDFTFLGCKIGC